MLKGSASIDSIIQGLKIDPIAPNPAVWIGLRIPVRLIPLKRKYPIPVCLPEGIALDSKLSYRRSFHHSMQNPNWEDFRPSPPPLEDTNLVDYSPLSYHHFFVLVFSVSFAFSFSFSFPLSLRFCALQLLPHLCLLPVTRLQRLRRCLSRRATAFLPKR